MKQFLDENGLAWYPQNVVKAVGPTIFTIKLAIDHHFKNRHINGNEGAKNWIRELKRVDKASGYSKAIEALKS